MRVTKKRVLNKTFGHRREQVIGKRRQLHSEGLHGLYSIQNTFRVFRSKRMRYDGAYSVHARAYKCIAGFSEDI